MDLDLFAFLSDVINRLMINWLNRNGECMSQLIAIPGMFLLARPILIAVSTSKIFVACVQFPSFFSSFMDGTAWYVYLLAHL